MVQRLRCYLPVSGLRLAGGVCGQRQTAAAAAAAGAGDDEDDGDAVSSVMDGSVMHRTCYDEL